MTQPAGRREAIPLDKIATMLVIVVCLLAIVWIARDLTTGGGATPRVTAAARAPVAPTRPPVRPAPPMPAEPVSIADAALKGSPQARVALVIYSDFECPFCARFANDTWPALDGKYVTTGKVRTAFRHLPIESIHPSAVKAAEASECAGRQGQFWPMHDVLFRNPKQLGEANLPAYAQQIGLNVAAFQTCLDGAATAKVRADAAGAAALGIAGTPAFLIGVIQPDGRVKVTDRIAGARPLLAFETALDKVLALPSAGTR
jgi:protein-disulfide isomerase